MKEKKDSIQKNREFQSILEKEGAGGGNSFLEKLTNNDPFKSSHNTFTIDNKTPYDDHVDNKSEKSNENHTLNRDSWLSGKNQRGRSVIDQSDVKSEQDKKLERQNSRKRNMLENSHHMHLSSSRKSITM